MLIEMFKLRQKSSRRNAKRKTLQIDGAENTRPLAMRVRSVHVKNASTVLLRKSPLDDLWDAL